MVQGHLAALNKGRPGERYLLTGENASFMQVFDICATISGTGKPRFSIPLLVIEAYGWLSVFASKIMGTLPIISPPVCTKWFYIAVSIIFCSHYNLVKASDQKN